VFNRYWNFTACIRSDNFDTIEQAVTRLLEQEEGCRRISKPPVPVSELEQLRSLPPWHQPHDL
jgi:hypothetical protein